MKNTTKGIEFMIDINEIVKTTQKAEQLLSEIRSLQFDNFDQWTAVSKIDDLEIAKVIIKILLNELAE